MSLKSNSIYKLSYCTLSTAAFTIANPQGVRAVTLNETFSAPSLRLPNASLVPEQTLRQLEEQQIQAIASPERLTPIVELSAHLPAEVATTGSPEVLPEVTTKVTTEFPVEAQVETPVEARVETPVESPIEAKIETPVESLAERLTERPTAQITQMPPMEVTVAPPRIEVGTAGMPSLTELPSRVGLPQDALLPSSFENPIVLGQAMDPAIKTATPISDSMPDPVWSRQIADLPTYQAAYSRNLNAWAAQIQQCMTQSPKLYVMRSDKVKLPIYFNGKEGTVIQNADGVSICPVTTV